MWHRKWVRPTAFEKLRMDAMMKGGCALSLYRRERGLLVPGRGKIECQHLVRNNKRMGHWYTIPLHIYYHQGQIRQVASTREEARELYGASLKDSMRVFRESHGLDDLELWVWLQGRLGMSAELPASKVFKRQPCSSLCDPPEPCSITGDGKCDVLTEALVTHE